MTTARHEPGFGDRVERICREYIELRYRLPLPLHALGKQLQLVHRFYAHYYTISQRFQHLYTLRPGIARPVTHGCIYRPGIEHRAVYLPQGTWYDWWSGDHCEGPTYPAHAPLERMPLCPGW